CRRDLILGILAQACRRRVGRSFPEGDSTMNLSIARRLRIMGVLASGLVVLATGIRAAVEADEPQPPVPDQQTPETGCRACPDIPKTKNTTITSKYKKQWKHGQDFSLTLIFTDETEYKNFASRKAYVCYWPDDDDKNNVVWEWSGRDGSDDS